MKAHQRIIRERVAEEEGAPAGAPSDFSNAIVADLVNNDLFYPWNGWMLSKAKQLILRYEWLHNMGRPVHVYGLVIKDDPFELLGVASFGWPIAIESRNICGPLFAQSAICLERGACVHYAPKNAASYLIRHATRAMYREHGYQIFYAYGDPDAGEIGTVYQAANWYYIGQGVGRTEGRNRIYWQDPQGDQWITTRSFYRRGTPEGSKMTKRWALDHGWKFEERKSKHKYVWFEGTAWDKHWLRKLCSQKYPFISYPKRA